MKRLFPILLIVLSFAACSKSVTTSEERSESDSLGFWWKHHDSINHALVLTADPIWQFGRHDEDIYDWNYQLKWFNECRQVLIDAYDSIHPGTRTKDKDLLMLDELIQFFETDPDYSTMGMIIAYDLDENFVTYKSVRNTKAILDTRKGRSFIKEINAWNDFHRILNKFCLNMLELGWFGGSGAGPACLALAGNISNRRLEDVERLNKFYHNELPLSSHLCTDTSNDQFENAVDSVLEIRKMTPEIREWYTDYQAEIYEGEYNETLACRDSLIEAYHNWISVREALLGFDNTSAHKDTMTAVVRELVLISGEE